MQIQYKLMTATLRGVLTKTEPILLDVDSVVKLSFLMSNGKALQGDYYAVFTDKTDREHKVKLSINGDMLLPEWLKRPQVLRLYVIQIQDKKEVKRWLCQNLRISNLSDVCKLKFEAGPDCEEFIKRNIELENEVNNQAEKITDLEILTKTLSEDLEAIKERLTALENKDNLIVGLGG